jgi:homoserine acetyltransferase
VSLNIPSKQLSEVVAPAADRSGLSIRQQLLIQSTIVMNSGGTLDAMSMSVSTVWRQRRTARENAVVIIKKNGYRRNLNVQFYIGTQNLFS